MIDFSTGVVNAKRGILLLLVHFNNDPLLHDDNDFFFLCKKRCSGKMEPLWLHNTFNLFKVDLLVRNWERVDMSADCDSTQTFIFIAMHSSTAGSKIQNLHQWLPESTFFYEIGYETFLPR